MNEPSARRRSERRSGGRPSERSEQFGRNATWAAVDRGLEVRERLAAVLEALDGGDTDTARINLGWVLEDLDAARGEAPA